MKLIQFSFKLEVKSVQFNFKNLNHNSVWLGFNEVSKADGVNKVNGIENRPMGQYVEWKSDYLVKPKKKFFFPLSEETPVSDWSDILKK